MLLYYRYTTPVQSTSLAAGSILLDGGIAVPSFLFPCYLSERRVGVEKREEEERAFVNPALPAIATLLFLSIRPVLELLG